MRTGSPKSSIATPEEAVGERKQVTVLFADIVGSTAIVQNLDEEQSADLLDEAVDAMAAAVVGEAGTVLRRQGDGLKAVFGAPYAQEDHADRACNAALHIQEVVRARRMKVRIGVNS